MIAAPTSLNGVHGHGNTALIVCTTPGAQLAGGNSDAIASSDTTTIGSVPHPEIDPKVANLLSKLQARSARMSVGVPTIGVVQSDDVQKNNKMALKASLHLVRNTA